MRPKALCWLIPVFVFGGCQSTPDITYERMSFQEIPGWKRDQMYEALPALKSSCQVVLKKLPSTPMITGPDKVGQAGDWHSFCQAIAHTTQKNQLQPLIEKHLIPYRVAYGDCSTGTITGYYEPMLRGSKRRHGPYQTPLYRLPPKSISYQIPRADIVAGALKNKGLELVWVDDPVDAFFLQIQGSGKVRLENGQLLNLGYAGQNGHPYYAIGKTLIERGELTPENVSMQTIKSWLRAHPREAESIMSLNPSYVFFKINYGSAPIGSQEVPLTAKRSIAVDRTYISLGTPLWLVAEQPKLQHLVVAQDTGGAIKGAVRADLFCGTGPQAGEMAGKMKARGELYVLLPR
jgi:membrane-bound lytic murein transglycosylase A